MSALARGQVDFSNGKIFQNMMRSALPMLVAQMLNLLYSIVDRIFIGQMPGQGVYALGGIGLCFPVISIITGFANLFGQGGAPLCSIARGEGSLQKARAIMNQSFYMLVGTALLLEGVGFVFAREILILFGASGQTLGYAVSYLQIYILGTAAAMVSLGMNPFINAQGFASMGMATVFLGAGSNLLLDPLFIFGLNMGVKGAALATILSQMLSAAFVLWFLTSLRAELRLEWIGRMIWNGRQCLDIISLGLASFVMQVTNSLVQIACNTMLGRYGGDLYISVMTIINSIRQIVDTPVIALSDGTSPIIGYNYGAENYPGVRRAIRLMSLFGLGYTILLWGLIMWRPQLLISIFNGDPDFLNTAIPVTRIYFLGFVFQALQYSGQAAFKSLNCKKQAIFFSLLRKVVIVVPLTLWLPSIMHPAVNGIFWAEPISNVIGGSLCFATMMMTVYCRLPKEAVLHSISGPANGQESLLELEAMDQAEGE